MTAWHRKHATTFDLATSEVTHVGITADSMCPTLHLAPSEVLSKDDITAIRAHLVKHPDFLTHVMVGGFTIDRLAEIVATKDPPHEGLTPIVAESIAHYGRWRKAGEPLEGCK